MKQALLVLEDGASFEGESLGRAGTTHGEVVFNTGLTGYQEVLTDPSYHGQIVVMTYPHIGNYGVNGQDGESYSPRVSGFVIRNLPAIWSSWRASGGLQDYLDENGIVGITEIDTRRLTRHIRDKGAMRGVISTETLDVDELVARARRAPSISDDDLVGAVTTAEPAVWPSTGKTLRRVAAFDFGIKHNILRMLNELGCEVAIYPARTPASELLAAGADGVFVSNGPGDPENVEYGVRELGALLGKVPVFGICLGHQLMALAAGLTTYKLPFGHHGANHPVMRLADSQVEITTQNHGFAVREQPFGYDPATERPGPDRVAQTQLGPARLTHVNLNDNTVEGFELPEQAAFCVQYHPEAGPGPHDSRYLFDRFVELMEGGVARGQG